MWLLIIIVVVVVVLLVIGIVYTLKHRGTKEERQAERIRSLDRRYLYAPDGVTALYKIDGKKIYSLDKDMVYIRNPYSDNIFKEYIHPKGASGVGFVVNDESKQVMVVSPNYVHGIKYTYDDDYVYNEDRTFVVYVTGPYLEKF